MTKRRIISVILIFTILLAVIFLLGVGNLTDLRINIIGKNGSIDKTYSVNKMYIESLSKTDLSQISENTFDYDKAFRNINAELAADIDNLLKNERVEAKDSKMSYSFDLENPFVISKAVSGRQADKKLLLEKLVKGLLQGDTRIELSYKEIKPKVTESDLRDKVSLRGQFETDYSFSGENRKHNIELACKRLDNIVIKSGEQFSFNKGTGERGEKNGYRLAPIISDGKYVLGAGGGICQVSTTFYNAFLLGGLRIIEAHSHSLPVGYVEPSFDAMVSGWSDLVVENVTDYPIFIKAKTYNNKLVVKIYGENIDYTVKRESFVTKIIPFDTEYVTCGEEKTGKNGLESYGKLVYYKDGKVIAEKITRQDIYNPQNAVMLEKKDIA